jgi:hypothetical protein
MNMGVDGDANLLPSGRNPPFPPELQAKQPVKPLRTGASSYQLDSNRSDSRRTGVSARQVAVTHQEFIDGARGLPAFPPRRRQPA